MTLLPFFAAVICFMALPGCASRPVVFENSSLEEDAVDQRKQDLSVEASGMDEMDPQDPVPLQEPASSEAAEYIRVYVCGCVKSPGVYSLPADARIVDAVSLAGGLTEEADPAEVNLADFMTDGQKIRIWSVDETKEMKENIPQSAADSGQASERGLVNLNTASLSELMTLPGIGQVRGQAILDYRSDHGPFGSIEELQNVSGIKGAVFQKLAGRITV